MKTVKLLGLMTVALNLKTSQFYSFNTNRNFEVLQFHNKTVLAYIVHAIYPGEVPYPGGYEHTDTNNTLLSGLTIY